VGFAFKDLQTAWAAMDGPLGAYVRTKISNSGLYALRNIWDNGFRQITTSSKPIATTEDLNGLKLRVPVSPLWIAMFRALGASPTSINWSETYSALQTKLVDGQENSLSVISTAKLYEVQKYCSLTNHMWDGFWCLANKRAWQLLPDDLRVIVEKQINAGALAHRQEVIRTSESLQAGLMKNGLIFNTPRTAPIRDKLRDAGFYKEWRSNYGEEAWALLENVAGQLS
jgi:tripartite ATP-independent transporter DctP family solute receptor